jgi:RNA polymerase sigma-70 factor, ECF subfamily
MIDEASLAGRPPALDMAAIDLQYRQQLRRYLQQFVRDETESDDLCQEVMLRIWQSWSTVGTPLYAKAWVYQVARNCALDYLRRARRAQLVALHDETPSRDQVGPIELRTAVGAALDQLPSTYRVLLMLDADGWRSQELAIRLGCSPGAVRNRLLRARRAFRKLYHR